MNSIANKMNSIVYESECPEIIEQDVFMFDIETKGHKYEKIQIYRETIGELYFLFLVVDNKKIVYFSDRVEDYEKSTDSFITLSEQIPYEIAYSRRSIVNNNENVSSFLERYTTPSIHSKLTHSIDFELLFDKKINLLDLFLYVNNAIEELESNEYEVMQSKAKLYRIVEKLGDY